jgi:hypothetical protein
MEAAAETRPDEVLLGYEVGTGAPVFVPLRHMAVTGQTQESGKTTTLEALVARAGRPSIAFVTKRGETSFADGRRLAPYFRDRADWQFVDQLLSAQLREKNKFLRPWLIRICRDTRTLADVQAAVRKALRKAKGISEGVYTQLDAYLELIVPEIGRAPLAERLALGPGLNVMDVSAYPTPMQMLFVQSAIEWVNEHERNVTVIVPEAWEFIPQFAGSPVKAAATSLVRKGGGIGNFIWIDSQDMAGVDNTILRGCAVWLIGVQREANEIKRNLSNIPASMARPTAADVALLRRGEFFVCFHSRLVKAYVLPVWMDADEGRRRATGLRADPGPARSIAPAAEPARTIPPKKEDPSMCTEHQRLADENRRLQQRIAQADEVAAADRARINRLEREAEGGRRLMEALAFFAPSGGAPVMAAVDEDAIVRSVLARLPSGGGVIQVTPPEKLRADFQREETERVVKAVGAMTSLQRRIVLLLEAAVDDAYVSQPKIAERLGRATAGGSFLDLTRAVKELAQGGFVEVQQRQGARRALRTKIAADLSFYQATPGDVEATYQRVLYALAVPEAAAA